MINYEELLSKRALSLKPSGIRKFFDIANEMDNVISLGVGEPDFKTPWAIRSKAIETLEKGKTIYTANAGLQLLRDEISNYLENKYHVKYNSKNEITVTVGGSEAIDICIRALVNPGDEVLVVEPCFVSYSPIVELTGGVAVPIETKAEDMFRLTAKALKEKITDKTKLLILPFPNNPTGAIMRREHLEEIAAVLRNTNIMILSDEIYSELTYNGKHVSIAELDGMKERTILVNGFSKSFSMTGWRLGYACGPASIIKQMTKIHQFAIMCAPTTSQYAAIEALRSCEENIQNMVEEYNRRRRYIVDSFNKLGLTCFEPEGAFYIFPSIQSTGLTSDEFCEKLLYSKKVAVVPGTAFGDCGEGFVRVSYSYSIKHINEAVRRIGEFLEELKA
ncbi:aminotransferase class I/II-fold pyridoxal phosphate-dependent enzyme [Paludicola sp. MB14-C6]|uniref:aminotransferase class I/II-fold pyridoxal phosphate-dependent enzyme n=1 Tax=Paludihabitans sp. MB14-C6 TaxID=3070656 RepID=UPI0027DCD290|nr:aminotransferase class I/II-fold pyridoxal phosphate-dependent enzyme [Paludicola sp. MB14-C6]WMJ22620.1 aminotransferase class I/II-fold pyridoxal phosphate-dependent enzyme [Paludicola sp. MB14-C6]